MEHEELTKKIIGCFYRVYNALGNGFLEKVYENALAVELRREGLVFGQQVEVEVCYRDEIVGKYIADFIVGECVVVEIKAMISIGNVEKAQVINYLKATGNGVGLILNFGKDADVKRVYWEHEKKEQD